MAQYSGLTNPIVISNPKCNIDYLYGPYSDTSVAKDTITLTLGRTWITNPERYIGLTVGIKPADKSELVEYWWQPVSGNELTGVTYNFIIKDKEGQVASISNNEIDYLFSKTIL